MLCNGTNFYEQKIRYHYLVWLDAQATLFYHEIFSSHFQIPIEIYVGDFELVFESDGVIRQVNFYHIYAHNCDLLLAIVIWGDKI